MLIPSCIINAVEKNPMDNDYFYGADQMWKRLTEIRRGTIEYLSFDMATLVNCIEMYYKGLLLASGVKVPESVMKQCHNLKRLTEEIETKICPLQHGMSRQDLHDRDQFLINLTKKYIDCRYNNDQVTKNDFFTCYDWAEKQRNMIRNLLMPPEPKQEFNYDDF